MFGLEKMMGPTSLRGGLGMGIDPKSRWKYVGKYIKKSRPKIRWNRGMSFASKSPDLEGLQERSLHRLAVKKLEGARHRGGASGHWSLRGDNQKLLI